MQTQADMGIGPVSYENCSVFKKGEGGPEAPGALRLRNKKATASVASSYSQNTPVRRFTPTNDMLGRARLPKTKPALGVLPAWPAWPPEAQLEGRTGNHTDTVVYRATGVFCELELGSS